MTVDAEDFLAHYGVKGMKWGVRKDRNRTTSGTRSRKKPPSRRDLKRTQKLAKKQELSRALKRMNEQWSSGNISDYRSSQSIKRGRLANAAVLSTAGSFIVAGLSRNPRTRAGATAAAAILTITTSAAIAAEKKSLQRDIIREFGDK